ncbi:HhoA/HhoB/HtrA family serine endopeptidase [Scytonema millei]|uniref:PDZ domain-containing protein n=1 Tax=Scytonema millei VB511283 TaxID=1245923 RepID=A0A9X5E162_9CYAN|nr:HhoA/HhoB/HtrA family serine endopeptidase [Scytonema millei]NHC33515.1 PDZ domain-containing protein [Scytonema millei VB511283]
MRLGKIMQYMRQLSSYVLAIVIGVFLSGCLQVLPSQADPVPQATISQVPTPPTPTQKAAIQPNSFVTAAVNRVGQAVVRIDTERTITRRLPDPFSDDPFFRRFFGENFPQQLPPERLQGLGSGFIVDSSGEILTNAHVVAQADKVTVTLKDGRVLEGQVQGVDEVTDLAAIKVNGKNLPVAPLGDSSSVQVGDWAIAVGNPLGLDNTVTLGIVSTLKRSSAQVGIPDKRLDFIQTDAAINPGNSGGPLLNDRGEVIGINTAIRADGMGIGFAIPIDKAKAIKDRLIRGEKVAHPYIGVQMETLTPSLARQNNSDPNSTIQIPEVNGVLVVRVLPNSPAAAAGLRRGDVIVQVDGQTITKAEQLQSLVEDTQVGQAIQVKVRRGDRTQQLSVRTGELQSASLK